MKNSKILITGSRNWKDAQAIKDVIMANANSFFIFGDCPTGADKIARQICDNAYVLYQIFYANWMDYGRSAGPRRNLAMIHEKPDIVYAFRSDGISKGTDDCVIRAKLAGIKVKLIGEIKKADSLPDQVVRS